MAWTWVTDDFNRTDRDLNGEPVGASNLFWERWRAGASTANPAWIVSNEPRPLNPDYADQFVVADVEPLAAGAPILGVGMEATFVAGSSFGEILAAVPKGFNGSAVWAQRGDTAAMYVSTFSGVGLVDYRPTVGAIALHGSKGVGGISTFTSTSLISPGFFGTWSAGTVVRLEVVFGGLATLFYNGTAVQAPATPASVNGNTLVGMNVRSYWRTDNWRVGVLT